MDHRNRLAVVIMTTLASLSCGADRVRREPGAEADPGAVSVLLVTVDTLRADHLSTYGYRLPTSPSIGELAEEGVLFENAFSGSACTAPSIASIMVGRYPTFHSVGLFNGLYQLNPAATTLAEVLSARGYRTGAIIGNPVLRAAVGFDQGFETYDDDLEGRELNRPKARERRADRVVDLAAAWIDAGDGRPGFLWLHFQDPHGPYAPPEGLAPFEMVATNEPGKDLPVGLDHSGHGAIPRYQVFGDERRLVDYVRRYDSEIAFFDNQFGRLLALLSDRGLLGSTLIVLTSDHGEAFGEDGFYFAHSHSVGLDQISVPLVIAGPGVPRGLVVRSPVSNVSVMASILDFVDIDVPEGIVGPPLASRFDAADELSGPVFFETPNQSGVVHGNAYFRRDRRAAEDLSFWDAGNPNTGGFWRPLGPEFVSPLDPAVESKQISSVHQLEQLLASFEEKASRARIEIEDQRVPVRLPDRILHRLRALGYLQ